MKLSFIVLIIASLLLLGLSLWISIHPPMFDNNLLAALAANRTTAADAFFNIITWAGSAHMLIPVGVVWSYSLYRRGHTGDAVFFISGFVLASLLARILKVIIARPRPGVDLTQMDQVTSYAFPSSHVSQFTAFALLFYLTLKALKPSWRLPASLLMACMIIVVALSRLYLQVHFPTDVIAGVLTGVIAVSICRSIFTRSA